MSKYEVNDVSVRRSSVGLMFFGLAVALACTTAAALLGAGLWSMSLIYVVSGSFGVLGASLVAIWRNATKPSSTAMRSKSCDAKVDVRP